MNTISMVGYRPSQKLHSLSLLAQSISRRTSGCLQVTNGITSWSIYLEQGNLAYASNSLSPFERLDRHLRQISRQVPSLVSAVRVQVRLLFESALESRTSTGSDYRAIAWLVEQQYLTPTQASTLIEEMAKEVLESFLTVTEGSYEFIEKERFDEYPHLCQLELRPLVEHCQNQLRRQQAAGKTPTAAPANVALPQTQPIPERSTSPQSEKLQTPEAAQPRQHKSGSAFNPFGGNAKTTTEAINKHHYTIACIDDSPTVLQAIKTFLDDTSFSVIMINDPIKALMQIVRSKPDLILLDVGMPNLDGYELCSLLRRHPSFKNIPIIMVTGNTGFIDRAKAKLVGASGYLTKPFTQSELLKMVFKHLT